MKIGIVYFSKGGRTKTIAEAMAEELGIHAHAISDSEAKEEYNLLFIGAAPYANYIDPVMKDYIVGVKPEQVKKAVLFSTSNWSMRAIRRMTELLSANGVEIAEETYHANAFHIPASIESAKKFAHDIKEKYEQ